MKANESIPNFDIKVREYTNYALKSIKNVCKNFGPRPVGSDAEKDAQEYMLKDLEKFCDEARREEYKCSDKAFMSWVPIGAALLILNTVFFTLGWHIAALVLSAITLFLVLAEFIFYKPILDVFFPQKTSGNVYGVRKATGETKKRIILSGHTDSAFEWTYTYKGGRTVVALIIVTAVIAILLGIGANIFGMVRADGVIGSIVWSAQGGIALKILAVIMYITVPVLVMAFKFSNYKLPVMGANDDLSGCFISCAAAKFLSDNDIRFENTEVAVLCAGGEEAGLRGSKAFAKANKKMLCEDGVETVFVSFDTIRELEFAKIYEKDMTGMVKNDRRVAELLQKAAANVGMEVPIGTIELGSTDAAAMSQAGVPASAFTAMDPTPARYYHTRLDDANNLSPQAIDTGVKIALEAIFLYDEKGI
ncbi:MAG: M20/M25/M40 family metallo-hydrolase [Clostridia bacterium]|nr:M20/M25/M40 family metallo-hydrolase [Clostridia bacterium]